ncbi:MAG: hypothetical protein RL166_791 [Actinomycetota bacterium]|jgi:hypothetical protein
MKQTVRIIAGFVLLALGFVLALPIPEFGVPLILFGTRLLGDRYLWANRLNAKVDAGWVRVKAWFKRVFRR